MILKIILGIAFFFSLKAEAQTKSVASEIHINSLAYKGDTIKFSSPKIVSLNKLGCSDILTIGKFLNLEFGIQIETLISRIGQAERLVVGIVFYLKKGKEWEQIVQPQYSEELFNILENGKNNNTYEMGYGGGSWDEEFYIDYRYRYTLIK
ncbi:MAG: hypothetical protein ABIR30_11595 [Chitinophagaceae bacterium]